MTLWALIWMCAGNCDNVPYSLQVILREDDCETESLAIGFRVEDHGWWYSPVEGLSWTVQYHADRPYVVWTECKALNFLDDPYQSGDFFIPHQNTNGGAR